MCHFHSFGVQGSNFLGRANHPKALPCLYQSITTIIEKNQWGWRQRKKQVHMYAYKERERRNFTYRIFSLSDLPVCQLLLSYFNTCVLRKVTRLQKQRLLSLPHHGLRRKLWIVLKHNLF